ncbi:MAG: transposase [Halioglobus sp.]|nr:transposase [Halioglobus sp.]
MMPRKPRFFVPGLATHIVQRGHNRQAIFFDDSDYRVFLSLLSKARDRYPSDVHAYVLMTNHVHILATPSGKQSISQLMQYLGRQYVPYINKKYSRSGTLWEGRFKASVVETSSYLLACYRYIEMNPVRAGMVCQPNDYPWSSFRKNALQEKNGLITEHPEYKSLGENSTERATCYRLLFAEQLSDEKLTTLRMHTQSGTPLGNAKFRKEVEATLSIKTGYPARGRPKRAGRKSRLADKGL